MSDTVIRVERLSKKYIIGHQQQERATTLRDAISNGVTLARNKILNIIDKQKEDPAYEEFWALKDVSFEVNRGDRLGIIGRNGAGKSTLLKILSRITEPTQGKVLIKGRVASLLEVGTGFHGDLTGRENIYLNGAILGMSKAEIRRKFDEIVAFSEVEKFLDTPVKRYSSGMYVRLAFGVAAHLDPEILVVDEVLAVGDVEFQKKCLGKMENVAKKEGRTVLFVSHNMGAISSLCNQAVYLENGKIRMLGKVESVVSNYLSRVYHSPTTNDLEKSRFPGVGSIIKFTDIKICSKEGGNTIYFGQRLKYELTIDSTKSFQELSIGSSIYDIYGTCIGTLFTKKTFSIQADRQMKFSLSIDNLQLAPGYYYGAFSIGTGGLNGSRKDLDVLIGIPTFQVLHWSENGDCPYNWDSRIWGSLILSEAEFKLEMTRELIDN